MEKAAVPAGGLPPPEVVALLSPFMYPTPHAIANNMLFLYIKYHMVLGITKYIQYTQARSLPYSCLTCVNLRWHLLDA